MKSPMTEKLLLALGLAALLGAAGAQQRQNADDEAPTEDAEAATEVVPEGSDELTPEEQEVLAEEAAEAGAEGPSGDGVTDEMRATMRRFVPSEQISEDSSVSFPNDI
ncbi:MAG: hypothetical protein AAGA23_07455 [Pseudomonadota bacterium]